MRRSQALHLEFLSPVKPLCFVTPGASRGVLPDVAVVPDRVLLSMRVQSLGVSFFLQYVLHRYL